MPKFEAYIAHSHDAQAPSTGIVYGQLNKGWPTMLWDLYNNDYDQAGSYFGAQEANHPLHAIYRYDDGSVSIDNLTGTTARGVTVQARVFDVAGHLLSDQTSNGRTVAGDGVNSWVLHPSVPAATTPPTPARTYFVELRVAPRSGGGRPQRVLALDPVRCSRLDQDDRKSAGDDDGLGRLEGACATCRPRRSRRPRAPTLPACG